jgi:hypothetical protein
MTNSITLTFTSAVDGAIRSGGRVLNESERAQERSPETTHNLDNRRGVQYPRPSVVYSLRAALG